MTIREIFSHDSYQKGPDLHELSTIQPRIQIFVNSCQFVGFGPVWVRGIRNEVDLVPLACEDGVLFVLHCLVVVAAAFKLIL